MQDLYRRLGSEPGLPVKDGIRAMRGELPNQAGRAIRQ